MLTSVLHKLNRTIDIIYMFVASALFIMLICASATQVFTRYVMNASLVGTEELARYCFIWMSLLGGSIAVGRWAHTSISVVYDLLPRVPQKLVFCLQNICVIVLGVLFIKGGITMMSVSASQLTPTLHIPKLVIYLAVPVSGFGMCLHAIEHICKALGELAGEEKMQEGEEAI